VHSLVTATVTTREWNDCVNAQNSDYSGSNGSSGVPGAGVLSGLRIVELGGIGPVPFGGMILADHGADVLRFDRAGELSPANPVGTLLDRNKRRIKVDLKSEAGRELALRCIAQADVLIEGFRPGVTERMGLGPQDCAERNDKLIYARMTGYGQTGPLAKTGGHDHSYISIAGALDPIGAPDSPPALPLNLLGDYAAGGMMMAFGIMGALWERLRSGQGQVIDCAIIDGAALLMTGFYDPSHLLGPRGTNWENGFTTADVGVYETSDHLYMDVCAVDPPFYRRLIETLGLDVDTLPDQYDPAGWPQVRALIKAKFAMKTQQEWIDTFDNVDAMVRPVLSPYAAPDYPHNKARDMFLDLDGILQPAPAPRFSRTPGQLRYGPSSPGALEAPLDDWGIGADELTALMKDGVCERASTWQPPGGPDQP
jgi:alpha-methylacyl-CoA racemase